MPLNHVLEAIYESKFPLGQLVCTPGCLAKLTATDMNEALKRHCAGDWGELGDEDKSSNDAALKNGSRIFSAYRGANGTKFWLITEADRSVTTFLLPEEY